MRALVISGAGGHALLDHDVPLAGPGDLLLAPLAVGLCATDLELLDGSMVYLRDGRAQLPLVPGHEWVARVVDPGAPGSGFAVGDVVVGECSIGCGDCPRVRLGRLPLVPAAAGDRRNEPRRRPRPAAALPRPQRPRRAAGGGRGGRRLRRADGGRAAGRAALRRRAPLVRARRGRRHPRLAGRCGLPRPAGRRGRRPGARCRSYGAAGGAGCAPGRGGGGLRHRAGGQRQPGRRGCGPGPAGPQRAPGRDRPDRGGVGAG